MNFSIYNSSTGGDPLYEKLINITTDSSGIYNAILDDVNLTFSEQYYLGIAVEDDVEMVPRINLTSSPYAYMAQNVSAGGIIFDENIDMGSQNITTTGNGFFSFLGSLVTRINKLWVDEINATGNIVTVGNVSAGYFIGNGSQLTGMATGTGDADYEFTDNDFNGSGNFTTTGNVIATSIITPLITGEDGIYMDIGDRGNGNSLLIGLNNAGLNISVSGGFYETYIETTNLLNMDINGNMTIDFGGNNFYLIGADSGSHAVNIEYSKGAGGMKLYQEAGMGNSYITTGGSTDLYLVPADDLILDPAGDTISATENIVGSKNISAVYFIGNGSQLTGMATGTGDADYDFGANNFNGSGNFTTTGNITAGNINATLFNGIDLSALGSGDTSYSFGSNNFNGTENFTTTGNITAGNINATLFNGIDLSALGSGDADYSFGSNDFNGSGNFTTTGNITAGNINATLFNGIDLSALGSGTADYEFGANNFNGSGNITTTGWIDVGNATFYNDIYLGHADTTNQHIYFYEDGSTEGEYLMWEDVGGYDRFRFSDSLRVYGNLDIDGYGYFEADIRTDGAGDDLWLGNETQADAHFQAYANGTVVAVDFIGNGSGLTGIGTGDADYKFTDNNFNGSGNFTTTGNITAGNINATLFNGVDLSALGSGDASYEFTDNNFNGSGNFTTTGNISGKLRPPAQSATAGTIPLKLISGIKMTTPEAGAFEYTQPELFFTNNNGRQNVVLGTGNAASTRIGFYNANAELDHSASFVYDGSKLYTNGLQVNLLNGASLEIVENDVGGLTYYPELRGLDESQIPFMSIQDALVIRGQEGNPKLFFYNSDITVGMNLEFDSANDKLKFTNARGGYEFLDGNVLLSQDNTYIKIGETDTDLQIYSDGTNGIINVNNRLDVLGDLNVTQNLSVTDEIQLGNGATLSQTNGSIIVVLGSA